MPRSVSDASMGYHEDDMLDSPPIRGMPDVRALADALEPPPDMTVLKVKQPSSKCMSMLTQLPRALYPPHFAWVWVFLCHHSSLSMRMMVHLWCNSCDQCVYMEFGIALPCRHARHCSHEAN